jgi:hypothetical protein
MRLHSRYFALIPILALGLASCNRTSEPSEAQMKDAMDIFLNHPPGGDVSDPIAIGSFKKGTCENPTSQGYKCTFTMSVRSDNPMVQMFGDLSSGEFYMDKDEGKWMMRAPL